MTSMSKLDLAKDLAVHADISCSEARRLVDCLFQELSDFLTNSYDVKLSGFGNFVLRHKKARPGRNPKTGESVTVAARKVVLFHAGQKLKSRLAG